MQQADLTQPIPHEPFTPEQEARIQELVTKRLDIIIALLTRMPVNYSRWPAGSTEALLRDLFPGHIPFS